MNSFGEFFYLDHAAATPVSEKVVRAMEPFLTEYFFNPSAAYLPAKQVREEFEDAKNKIAHFIGAKGADLIMTSGATEANTLAFSAINSTVSFTNIKKGDFELSTPVFRTNEARSELPQILVLETEHASVLENAKRYNFEVIKVDRNGVIDLIDLQKKITDATELVSASLANNELGTMQPLAEIAKILREVRLERLKHGNKTQILLHSDASQGLNLMTVNVARIGVDLMTLNAAKVGGPKGVGALYVGHGVRLSPLQFGGGQERNLRSGTENVPGVIGFATAIENLESVNSSRKKYEKMTDILLNELNRAEIKPVVFGNKKTRLKNFLPVSFPGIDAERLIYKLEKAKVYVSTGAACAASKGESSYVLKAIGANSAEIMGSLRISLGVLNDEENVRKAGKLICQAVDEEAERMKNE